MHTFIHTYILERLNLLDLTYLTELTCLSLSLSPYNATDLQECCKKMQTQKICKKLSGLTDTTIATRLNSQVEKSRDISPCGGAVCKPFLHD